MFNGLIREIAQVVSYSQNILRLKANFRPNLGDSIAVNGACLSVIKLHEDSFSVELSAESRANIAVENLKERVHIEPAMKLGCLLYTSKFINLWANLPHRLFDLFHVLLVYAVSFI